MENSYIDSSDEGNQVEEDIKKGIEKKKVEKKAEENGR